MLFASPEYDDPYQLITSYNNDEYFTQNAIFKYGQSPSINSTNNSNYAVFENEELEKENEEKGNASRCYDITEQQVKNVVNYIRSGIDQVYPKKTIFNMDILQRWIYLDRITSTHYDWWIKNIVENGLPDAVINNKEFHLVSITSAEQCYNFLANGMEGGANLNVNLNENPHEMTQKNN